MNLAERIERVICHPDCIMQESWSEAECAMIESDWRYIADLYEKKRRFGFEQASVQSKLEWLYMIMGPVARINQLNETK